MNLTSAYQHRVINEAQLRYAWKSVPEKIKSAFFAIPRHTFVNHYYVGGRRIEVSEENVEKHLDAIYSDVNLSLWLNEHGTAVSSMTQPVSTLRFLQLLDVSVGHRVFEVGTGSGWTAAMIGQLVGTSGFVVSTETIPELAEIARKAIDKANIGNVKIIQADGAEGYISGGPYDRVLVTAASEHFPVAFHHQVRNGGRILTVLAIAGAGQRLFLLEKRGDYFESLYSHQTGFVPMSGSHAVQSHRALSPLDPVLSDLLTRPVATRKFWWGSCRGARDRTTIGLRSFLSVTEKAFLTVERLRVQGGGEEFFGLYDTEARSLAIARDATIEVFGNMVAYDRLIKRLHEWIDLGMPTAGTMQLRIFPNAPSPQLRANQWAFELKDSIFVWSLNS